jgi:hypothetical protein
MATSALVENGEKVRELRKMLNGFGDDYPFAGAITDLIDYDRWREFIEPADRNRKTYQAFTEFCQKSLKCHPETLMDRVRDSPSLKARIEELAIQPHGGDHTSPASKSDNVTLAPLQPKRGNSQASGMRRLMKDWPDLAKKVERGELTVHAAAVKAGFRKPTVTVRVDSPDEAARVLLKHFTLEELEDAVGGRKPPKPKAKPSKTKESVLCPACGHKFLASLAGKE